MDQIRTATRCPHVRIAQNQPVHVSTHPRIRQSQLAPFACSRPPALMTAWNGQQLPACTVRYLSNFCTCGKNPIRRLNLQNKHLVRFRTFGILVSWPSTMVTGGLQPCRPENHPPGAGPTRVWVTAGASDISGSGIVKSHAPSRPLHRNQPWSPTAQFCAWHKSVCL